jgi:hypothetical protein
VRRESCYSRNIDRHEIAEDDRGVRESACVPAASAPRCRHLTHKYFGPGNEGWLLLVRIPEPEKLSSGRLMGSWLTFKNERATRGRPLTP